MYSFLSALGVWIKCCEFHKQASLGHIEIYQFNSVQSLCPVRLFQPHELQHSRPPHPSPTPGVYSNSCPLSWWCHPTISAYVIPFSYLQSFPESGSFRMSQFSSGDQSIGVSAGAVSGTSALPMNTQDWYPLGWTGWISLQSKGLSRVFSNTTVPKHQFFDTQLSLWSVFNPWIGKIPWRRAWQPISIFLPGQRSLGVIVHRVGKSWAGLKGFSMRACLVIDVMGH